MIYWAGALGFIGDVALIWATWRYFLKPQITKIVRQELAKHISPAKGAHLTLVKSEPDYTRRPK